MDAFEKNKICESCEENIIHPGLVEKAARLLPPEEALYDLAELFKVFGDSTRIKLLYALLESEMCVCDLAALLGVTKSAASHQLKALRLANLVKFRRDGQVIYYSLADDHVKYILDIGFDHIRHE